jgi:hypothetical protein
LPEAKDNKAMPEAGTSQAPKPVEVRARLVDALRLDLAGPFPEPLPGLGDPAETLPQAPSRWYLTGFLVPAEAAEAQRIDEGGDEEFSLEATDAEADDDSAPEPGAARQRYLPSSIGLSMLAVAGSMHLKVTVRWGD